MKKFFMLLFGIAAIAVLSVLAPVKASAAGEADENTLFAKEKETIADVIGKDKDLSSLSAVLKAANLTDALKGKVHSQYLHQQTMPLLSCQQIH